MLGTAAILLALMLAAGQDQVDAPAEALHAAVRTGNLAEVKQLIDSGVPVDARDALGGTPLLEATWTGQLEIAAFLIAHGANVNAVHREAGSTPLEYGVLTGRTKIVALLLGSGARLDGRYRDGEGLLHVAAARGYAQIIDELVKAKADVQALDANGNTPLDSAVLHDQRVSVEALLRNHANVTYVHPVDGRGALDEACIRGYADLLVPLIDAGANPTARDRFGQTPLDLALAYKNGNVVAALLRLGRSLKESEKVAEETMESATMRGQTEIARILLDNGLDVNKPSANGSSYLSDAALKGQKKVVQLLLDRGASVETRNPSGGTALHDAALGGDAEVVALLLDRGADIDGLETESGATPLMVAASMGRVEVVRLLLKRGANRALKDKAGHTALDRARDTGSEEIVQLLRQGVSQLGR